MWLSRSQLLERSSSAVAASMGFRLCARCGQALVPGALSLPWGHGWKLCSARERSSGQIQSQIWPNLAFSKAGRAACSPESGQQCQGASDLAAFNSSGRSVFSKSLMCLFSLLLLVTCKMLTANYLNKQCRGR